VRRRRRLTGAAREAERRRETVDILLGVLGFFTALVLLSTVAAEVRGDDALARALVLAVLVVLVVIVVRMRRVLTERLDRVLAEEGRG
jgi:hypothetical protein